MVKRNIEELERLLDSERDMKLMFLETSQERGKALDILCPHIRTDEITELLAELYDFRMDKGNRKIRESYAFSKEKIK